MNATTRKVYFTQVWPAAARRLGCERRDDDARRAATREAMRAIKGPDTDSITELGAAEVTALFTYLKHLARPDDLKALSAWMSCQEDYRKYNRVQQGNWWRVKAGYQPRGRIERDRFGNRPHDGLFDEDRMSAEEADQYLMTMRARARAKSTKAQTYTPRPGDPF